MRFSITSFLKIVTLGLLASPFVLASIPASQAQKTQTKKVVKVQTQTINVNQADASDLEALPGIGPALAARIVAFRQENGPFKTVAALTQVRGIGEKMLAKLRPMVSL